MFSLLSSKNSLSHFVHLLWFNLSLVQIFVSFVSNSLSCMLLSYITIAKTKETKFEPRIKLNHNIPILVGVTRDANSDKITDFTYATARNKCVQTDATLLDVTCYVRLHTLLHVVACCCSVWSRSDFWDERWAPLKTSVWNTNFWANNFHYFFCSVIAKA